MKRPMMGDVLVVLVVVVLVLSEWAALTDDDEHAVPYERCLADCEGSGRALWAWSTTSCECTP